MNDMILGGIIAVVTAVAVAVEAYLYKMRKWGENE